MRCKACDALLKDHEMSRVGLFSGEFIDLCDNCYSTIADDILTEEELFSDDNEDIFSSN